MFSYSLNVRSFIFILLSTVAATASAGPAQIVIIRHGEKPAVGNELAPQGCERAMLLPKFFENNATVNQYGEPVAVYAERPSRADGTLRPIQTIAPTAYAMTESSSRRQTVYIQAPFTKKQYGPLAQELLSNPAYSGKTVLVSWEHDAILFLAQALGVTLTPTTQVWPPTVFDEAWVIRPGGQLAIIPEFVLPSDNPNGGSQWALGPFTPRPTSPTLPLAVSQECVNNNALNVLVNSIVTPPLTSDDGLTFNQVTSDKPKYADGADYAASTGDGKHKHDRPEF